MEPYYVPLRREYGYLPNLAEIPADIARKAKLMIVNYPSNPLAAVADYDFFARLVHFARRHDILIAHDLAYSEMAFDGCKPLSILEIPGAKEVAVEFHSLSKSFNMAGCRIGFAVGHPGVISALGTLKANIDYGVFRAVQRAGIAALREDMKNAQSVARIYEKRRDLFMEELQRAGWDVPKPKATMFVWAEIPPGWSARQFSREMLLQTGVAVVPGDAFGREGEGFVRIALVQPEDKLREAASRIGQFWKGAGRSPCQT
jgi:LL-diaminopimelate aminotransferase